MEAQWGWEHDGDKNRGNGSRMRNWKQQEWEKRRNWKEWEWEQNRELETMGMGARWGIRKSGNGSRMEMGTGWG